MKDKKKGLLHLFIIIAIIGLCSYITLVGITSAHKGSAKNIKLGLDLAGGVSITYEATKDNPTATEMKDTIQMMQQRAEVYSTESSVVQVGDNRIEIDIPGVADADEVLKSLGKEGSLDFVAEDDMKLDKKGNPQYTKTVCTGKHIKKAEAGTQQNEVTKNKEYVVELSFNAKGTKLFADATKAAYPTKKKIYIVYDGKVLSAPNVQAEITDGKAVISGSFDTYDKAEELASMIRIGALPVELKEIQSQVVGAQLGQDAIQTSLLAGAIGFALVVIFMLVFYRLPGLAASIALVFYLVLMLVALNGLNITLTLPGVAGIILNIGMAVDANVIIFTRIKEELAKGKSVQTSIKLGFEKALSAIVDGNVTTLIAAFVLYIKGSGTIRGFATTLAMGIILSMFTALYITKYILQAMYSLGVDDVKYFGVEKPRRQIKFVQNRVKFFVISGVLIAGCVVCLIVNKATSGNILNYGLDFLGGTTYDIPFGKDTKIDSSLKKEVESIFAKNSNSNDIVISEVSGSNELNVKTVELTEEQRANVTNELSKKYSIKEKNIQIQSISASVSGEMKRDAVLAVIIAAICMLIYIWFRFKDIVFAGSAVLALLHDVIVVLLVYAAAKISVGNTFIACMLTIVGYSINATIVIFDRIRENIGTRSSITDERLSEIVNDSITQTLTRSINTSLTTFFMVFMLAILGVDSVREFAIPLLAGIVCGAYSSVCITGTLWYTIKKATHNKSGKAAKKAK
ncbi:MAG: protein translocase subunit SecDF [Butyribacter sp.]|jgi:protein-export membrane protein, secD/secF family|uniref:Multifunctional fusion protein n=1 Tax=Butyribacter intestini TaxID=1703332 RepID=A0AAW3JQ90_9FIRM|nr:protein translocase subunit SecDF [Butyribacter intestini]KQC84258.1 preprotein translocase subunit SecD [Butyribacter intestini]MBS5365670.1 protein translocase subunit SecDF [Clostridium sp.]MCQ5164901.1 protein translocase subunit SecDF [Roseburia hominis]RHU72314.1 protein translocase subunit SecDF [Butyribacter intestini]